MFGLDKEPLGRRGKRRASARTQGGESVSASALGSVAATAIGGQHAMRPARVPQALRSPKVAFSVARWMFYGLVHGLVDTRGTDEV